MTAKSDTLEPIRFSLLTEAPYAIPRFRRFILDLAVRGKLVPQDPNDEPAARLVHEVFSCRNSLVGNMSIRSNNELPQEIADDEVPFRVADGWQLVRLGHALVLVNGKAFKPSDWSVKGLPIVRIQNLNDPHASFNYCEFEVPEKFHLKNGDFLISWSGTPGTSFGAHIWDRGPAILNQHIFRVEFIADIFVPAFLKIAINSRLLELIDQAHGGAGLQHVTKPMLERLPLTLPPLEEQNRIVAKVDELMAHCDALEAAQQKREAKRDRLVTASFRALTAPNAAPDILIHNSKFVIRNFPSLTTKPEHIKQLRQTILDLAVRGKLVPQDPNDEPAQTVLQKISLHAPFRQSVSSSPLSKSLGAFPFELPDGWSVSRLRSILDPTRDISYGVIKLGPEPQQGGVFILRCSNVRFRRIDLNGIRKVTEQLSSEYGRTILRGGEVLINVRGTLGGCAVVPPDLKGYNIAREVAVIPVHQEINSTFLVNVIASPYFQNRVDENLRGIAYTGLNLGLLRDFLIPLPPLAEQRRIVSKVDELFALCDELETQLTNNTSTQCQFLEATLQKVLPPQTTTHLTQTPNHRH